MTMKLQEKLATEAPELREILFTLATGAKQLTELFHPEHRKKIGTENASGESQLGMDITADNLFFQLFQASKCVKSYASEEREEIQLMTPYARYSVTIDPLDGSSLLDVNLAVGTIVGIWDGDILTSNIIGAAYIVYGPTTVLVYSTGQGVHEFMLQQEDFVCVQENIHLKAKGNIYSSGGLKAKWTKQHTALINYFEEREYKLRYSGGLVPDVHQIFLKGGGIFTYPALLDAPEGKLRLLFELSPFAFIAEHAGGAATNGKERILDLPKKKLHQRSPFYIGSDDEIRKAQQFLTGAITDEKKKTETGEMTMNFVGNKKIFVPADVPAGKIETYMQNYKLVTKNTGRLFLFAGDQKIEHLNDDFYGSFDEGTIPTDDADPEHLFKIAHQAKQHIGMFATQYGLLAKYGKSYPDVPYLVKMNSKSHLVKTKQAEPNSSMLVSFDDVLALKENSGLNIVGVGYTVYVGSVYEPEMLAEAGRLIAAAHRKGMIVVLWMYPRGTAVPDEKDPHIIAGAAGVAACLGADFVKVNYCKREGIASEEAFKEAILAAGRTGLITSGGSSVNVEKFLQTLHKQIHVSGAIGNATGRNIHQKKLDDALRMCAAVAAVTYWDKDVAFAMDVYNVKVVFS